MNTGSVTLRGKGLDTQPEMAFRKCLCQPRRSTLETVAFSCKKRFLSQIHA